MMFLPVPSKGDWAVGKLTSTEASMADRRDCKILYPSNRADTSPMPEVASVDDVRGRVM